VAVHAVRPHELVVVAAPDLAAGAAQAAGPPDAAGLLAWLARQTWLLREPGSGTRASTAALLAEMDIAPLALMLGSNGAIRESARVGLGITLVSRDAVAAELAAGQLAEIGVPGTPLHRDWYLLAHRQELPSPASRLVDHVLHTGAFRAPGQGDARSPGTEN
jgi:DNA-binding transcriptional LysR family regulator